jgi:sugar lactone lactonase YvrE
MSREAEKIDFEITHHLPNQLGECPVWDEREELLYWVDIKARQILRHDPSREITESRDVPGRPGMLALCEDGGLVVAQERGLQRFSFEAGLQEFLVQVEPSDNKKLRVNDSKVDRSGRLWLSSMADPSIPGEKHGSLFFWERGKPVRKIAGPLGVGNGMAFAKDRETFWYADTHARTIWKCRMNPEDGSLIEQEVFAEYFSEPGRPDGACIDAEGFYWVAVVDGWRLDRFSPDGNLERSLAVPFQKPSCPAFGGKDLSLLYVTSISRGSSTPLEPDQPDAGKLIALEPGISGVSEPRLSNWDAAT